MKQTSLRGFFTTTQAKTTTTPPLVSNNNNVDSNIKNKNSLPSAVENFLFGQSESEAETEEEKDNSSISKEGIRTIGTKRKRNEEDKDYEEQQPKLTKLNGTPNKKPRLTKLSTSESFVTPTKNQSGSTKSNGTKTSPYFSLNSSSPLPSPSSKFFAKSSQTPSSSPQVATEVITTESKVEKASEAFANFNDYD